MKYLPCCIYSFTSCLMMYKGIDGSIWATLLSVGFLYAVRDDVEIIYVQEEKNESKKN